MVYPKDKIKGEEKTELIYRVPCKNCSSSYVGETGRKFGLSVKEHKKEVDSFTTGTHPSFQGKGEQCNSQVSLTDHAVEENHVIDWDKAKMVDREAQRQTRWIRKILTCLNRYAGSIPTQPHMGPGDFQVTCSIIIIIIIIISLLKTHVRRTCLHSKNITMKHTRVILCYTIESYIG